MASYASRSFAYSSLIGFVALVGLFALLYFGRATPAAVTGSVQVTGSESMRALVAACAEAFMGRHPKADIIVKDGGSGDGVAAVLHGIADVGMVSRELTQRERDYAASKSIELDETPLARDGVTVIVNRANPMTSLELDQLQAVFSGKVRNWRDLGGEDEETAAYARAAGSGTATLFGDRVLGGQAPAASVVQLSTNEAIVAEVGGRKAAIGYASLGALRAGHGNVKPLALKADAAASASEPTPDAVRAGTYPLSRTLLLVAPRSASDAARAFISFCAGEGGRELIRKAGYISVAHSSE